MAHGKIDLGLVLRVIPFQEKDKIVHLLTLNHGRISIIARNAVNSRRFGSALDLFSAAEFTFTDKRDGNLGFLEAVEIKRPFDGLRRDYSLFCAASFCAELIERLVPERMVQQETFKLLANTWAGLDENDRIETRLLDAFLAKFLQIQGVQPQISCCLGCAKALTELGDGMNVYFSVERGGWNCLKCAENLTLEMKPDDLLYFQLFFSVSIKELCSAVDFPQKSYFELLWKMALFHFQGLEEHELKSLKMIRVMTPKI